MPETIFIVDDDPAVSHALECVGGFMNVPVRSFASADDFLMAVPPEATGCLILDLMLEGRSGMDLLRELRQRASALPVIVVSGHATVSIAVEAMQLNAITVLEKPFRLNDLMQKIEFAFRVDQSEREVRQEREAARSRISRLTTREREVLVLVAKGFSNKQIAAHLGLSLRAIEDRRARLMRRLDSKSVADALMLLQRANMQPSDLISC